MTEEKAGAVAVTPWSPSDEKNWVANRVVLRNLKKQGEKPSTWLAAEHRDLDNRRKARKQEEQEAAYEVELRAWAKAKVAEMPPLTEEQCRRIARILQD